MTHLNVIIIGSGPAGYAAALYLSEYSPTLFEGKFIGTNGPGGQLTTTTDIDNYPGFPNTIDGKELMSKMKEQALNRKINIKFETVKNIENMHNTKVKLPTINDSQDCEINDCFCNFKILKNKTIYKIITDENEYTTNCIVIATGSQAKKLLVPGSEECWMKGISACAVCDGWCYKDKKVVVIGGGDTAMHDVLYLSNIAKEIILIHRSDKFRARVDLLEKVKKTKNVKIMTFCVLKEVIPEIFRNRKRLSSVVVTNKNKDEKIDCDGLFFAIGHTPNTFFLEKEGYLKTGKVNSTCMTGIFAAGDVKDFIYRQAVTAAASGAIAGLSAKKYLDKIGVGK